MWFLNKTAVIQINGVDVKHQVSDYVIDKYNKILGVDGIRKETASNYLTKTIKCTVVTDFNGDYGIVLPEDNNIYLVCLDSLTPDCLCIYVRKDQINTEVPLSPAWVRENCEKIGSISTKGIILDAASEENA